MKDKALIQVLRAPVGSEFDVVEVKEVGASQMRPILKTNRLPDGTHRGEKLWSSNLRFGLTLSQDEWNFVALSCRKLEIQNQCCPGSHRSKGVPGDFLSHVTLLAKKLAKWQKSAM